MTDPKRWLEDGGGATFDERELLRAGRDTRLPDALRKRVWAGVTTGLAAVETAAAAGSALQNGAAAKGALTLLSSTAIKGMAALAIAGGVGLGVVSLRSSMQPRGAASLSGAARSVAAEAPVSNGWEQSTPAVDLPRASELEVREPHDTANAETPTVSGAQDARARAPRARPNVRSASPAPVSRPVEGDPAPVDGSREARRASRLAEESAAVVAIRKTLLAGDAAEALRMLDRASAQFPDGVLGQEREALAVRALVQSGQKEAARKRGEGFLRAFPRSPHAAELRALLAQ
jgi:hypothetical protein